MGEWLYLIIGIAVVCVIAIAGFVTTRVRRPSGPADTATLPEKTSTVMRSITAT